jgi:two-component system, chemotaxis family, response regulator Rcp1
MDHANLGEPNHLLVIEDNPSDVDLLRRALASAAVDCQLTVIDDGAEALALFRPGAATEVPDLAIIDLNLPKHSGLEVIEKMRANPKFAEVPVVIMSSSSAPRDRSSLEKFRIRKYIVKPADLEEVMRIGWQIRELLRHL